MAHFLIIITRPVSDFMDTTDIPHHEVELDENVTPREVAQRVYRIFMVGIGADWEFWETPVSISD